jgi:phospholipid/cholesterol/gamma-HCH transport system substrate-binding protein
MRRFDLELTVGLFVIAGMVCLGYLSVKLGGLHMTGNRGYDVQAVFSNSGGLKPGSSVVIAGVDIGVVKDVALEEYEAKVVLTLPQNVKIQEDAIASIKTKGLLGEKYVDISPGASEKLVEPGGRIRETLPAIDIEQLISSFVFGKI